MNIVQIEHNIKKLIESFSKETFIYDLLLAYGLPKSAITLLKKGNRNMSKIEGEISWKKKLFFKEVYNSDLHVTISDINKNLKHNQRFVIVTDYETVLAIDTKTQDKLDIQLKDVVKHYDFFLPWAGMEKTQHQNENPADVKAAEKMAKLFDEIKKDNPDESPEFIHGMNIFLSRLLFCFFAEDTNIFKEAQFTNALASHTQKDGGDLDQWFDSFFEVLNTKESKRKNIPAYLDEFPYVNGGLFANKIETPMFSRRSRQAVIDNGELDWSAINPDIFGSMIQAVITPEHRGGLGMHYTSVPNIMKVIEPLFLNELYEEFEKAKFEEKLKAKYKKLQKLRGRLYNLKIFDPACGSGNFLIIAYKELRKLEMKIFKEGHILPMSAISLSQFYGIELDDFAHEIATLSLWLAEHQMNVDFYKEFGRTNPTLPLKEAGNIVCGNACRLDWEKVCPKNEGDEIYILGNPPYLGARNQEKNHKDDMDFVLNSFSKYRDLDYIACWFYKGAKFIQNINAKLAFVSTNSICQGLQVGLLWPNIFQLDIEIDFAHTSFKWINNAKGNAGVTVVIIGLGNILKINKFIFSNGLGKQVHAINAYLSDGANTIIQRRSKPLANFKEMSFGNMPNDGGGLILTEKEKEELLNQNSEANKYIKKLLGAQEFIRGQVRYCLWIRDDKKIEAEQIPFIADRIEKTKNHRINSKDKGTKNLAIRSHQFRDTNVPNSNQIIMPSVSSEKREYIPSGFLGTDTVISNSAQVVYDAEPWLLGVLNSKLHMVWLRTVGGKLEERIRYSKDIVYNNFPFPPISKQRKEEIAQCVFRILEEREKHSEKTLAQLYDPDKMPEGLREAHHQNDLAIERCYRSKPFTSDEERLEYLFKLYEKMIAEEKTKNSLFEKEKKTRKKK
jgi:hypothetical protein